MSFHGRIYGADLRGLSAVPSIFNRPSSSLSQNPTETRLVLAQWGILQSKTRERHAYPCFLHANIIQGQQDNDVPGLAVALVGPDSEEVWTVGSDGNAEPITTSTPFLIGSVAKTFTCTMVLQLVAEGKIRPEDPIAEHLTWLDHHATIKQLLDHTAGYTAADGLAVSERYRENLSVTDAAGTLSHSGEIGSYSYSSANYLLLGALIEEVTGNSFAEQLHMSITDPLEMSSTAVDGSGPGLPPGHRQWWGHAISYTPGSEPSGAPYGYLVSTLDDLVTYSRAHLDAELLPENLRAAAWDEQVSLGDGYGYGLGTGRSRAGFRAATDGDDLAHCLYVAARRRTRADSGHRRLERRRTFVGDQSVATA